MKRRRGPDRRESAGRPPNPSGQPSPSSAAGRTDDPGASAARARVSDLLERATRVELQVVVVAPPDPARMAARDRARAAASVAGRGPLLREAVAAAREATIRAFARGGYSGTWAATDMAVSVTGASDRVAAAAALEEAVIAAVVEDLVDDDTLDELRSTWEGLVSLRGIRSPGSLSALAVPAALAIRGPIQVAIVVAFVVLLAAGALVAGIWEGLVFAIACLVLLAGLAWRRRSSAS